jgi:hypothetical protein
MGNLRHHWLILDSAKNVFQKEKKENIFSILKDAEPELVRTTILIPPPFSMASLKRQTHILSEVLVTKAKKSFIIPALVML